MGTVLEWIADIHTDGALSAAREQAKDAVHYEQRALKLAEAQAQQIETLSIERNALKAALDAANREVADLHLQRANDTMDGAIAE